MTDRSISRRAWLAGAAASAIALVARTPLDAQPRGGTPIAVYKDPNCGCCAKWVDHVAAAGFKPTVHDTGELDLVKATHRVPNALHSCHTAVVGGYVVEGHVPAADIQRLLREKPAVRGIAVGGMPIGSPGMEVPGRPADRYDVVAFLRDGTTRVFARH